MGTRVKLPSLFPLPLSPRGSQLHHRTSRFPLPHVRGRGPQQETRFKFRIPPGRTAPLPPEGRGHMGQTAEPSLVRGPGGAEPHMPYRWRKRQGAGAGAYGPGEVAPGLATRAPGASCAAGQVTGRRAAINTRLSPVTITPNPPDGDRLQSLLRLQDSDCTRSEPSIFAVNGPDLSLQ